MKTVWTVLVIVVLAGAIALLWPTPPSMVSAPESVLPKASEERSPASVSAPPPPAAFAPAPKATTTPTVRIERQPDGTLRLDGRFMLTGAGTESDPFVVSWPLLFSASETVDAAAGRMTAPPHVDFLNGQWIQISAFLAPPLWGEQTRDLLVMKNRWDGCCIGLPPTPFDCIEASLAQPLKLGAQHSISFGTVRGRLVVEPFKAGSFLIGLYRLESAQLADMKPQ